MSVKHMDHLNITVRDFDETAAWYGRIFGFQVVEDDKDAGGQRWGVLRAGDAMLCIYERPEFVFEDVRARGIHGIGHFSLRMTDRPAWEQTVDREALELDYGGAVPYAHSTSWYVKDPTGWAIEVVCWDDDQVAF